MARKDFARSRGAFILVFAIGVAFLGLFFIGLWCHRAVPPIAGDPAFKREVTVAENFFYLGQPWKTAAYQGCCLALPFLLAGGFWLGRRLAGRLSVRTLERLTRLGALFYLLLVAWSAWPMIFYPSPPLPLIPPSWFLLPFDYSPAFLLPSVLFVAISAGLLFLGLRSRDRRRTFHQFTFLLLLIWAALIPSRFYPACEIDDEPRYTYHLNSVLDALSQSVNGHHLLVDFPHIYGGYVEMLAPIIRLFPRSPEVLLTALAVPNILGTLCLLLTARLVVRRRPALLFLCGLTLLAALDLCGARDLTYGYSTARVFFPAAGLLAATLYFRRPGRLGYAATTGLAAVAGLWNLDTGLVLWASWLATLMAMEFAGRRPLGALRHLLLQTLTLAVAWAGFLLYLRASSGQWPALGMLFYFQRFVLGTGYSCVPLICPDLWVPVLGLYVMGLALAARGFFRRMITWRTPTLAMISLLGLGVSSYFMGRSAESNLMAVAYPAIILACMLGEEVEILSRRPDGGLVAGRLFILPTKLALVWWSFLFVAGLPDLLSISGNVIRHWGCAQETPFRAKAAFVRQATQPGEGGVFFLSNQSGLYYYLSDTVRPLKMPGIVELMRASDMDVLLDAIRRHQIEKLFVEQNFYSIAMYRPDVYEQVRATVQHNYRQAASAPDGKLILYVPR
jgi:hypothetical protein